MRDKSTHKLLHTLWTKAVGTKDYDKKEWLELERILNYYDDLEYETQTGIVLENQR